MSDQMTTHVANVEEVLRNVPREHHVMAHEYLATVAAATTAAERLEIINRVVDLVIREARRGEWCEDVDQALVEAFGRPEGGPWRLNDGGEIVWVDSDENDRRGWARPYYDADGYGRDGLNVHGRDKEGYTPDGYDRDGYDRELYDRDQYHRDTKLNRGGYDRNGYNAEGLDESGRSRYRFDPLGWDVDGYSIDNRDRGGYDREGFNKYGTDRDGFHKDTGLNGAGTSRDGYDAGNDWAYRYDRYGNAVPASLRHLLPPSRLPDNPPGDSAQ